MSSRDVWPISTLGQTPGHSKTGSARHSAQKGPTFHNFNMSRHGRIPTPSISLIHRPWPRAALPLHLRRNSWFFAVGMDPVELVMYDFLLYLFVACSMTA